MGSESPTDARLFSLVARNRSGSCQVWAHEGMAVVVGDMGRGGRIALGDGGEYAVMQALAALNRVKFFNGTHWLRVSGERWIPLYDAATIAAHLYDFTGFFSMQEDTPADPEQWIPKNTTHEDPLGRLEESRALIYHEESPPNISKMLAAKTIAPGVAHASGVVHQPIHGELDTDWIDNHEKIAPAKDTNYEHLKTLFSALELRPDSHAAVYVWLLAAFSARSFSVPRPFLLVDSWMQGRGKSEVGQALCTLLDNTDGAISAGNGEKFSDTVAAMLTSRRTVFIDNLDNESNWTNGPLVSSATGPLEVRRKYNRDTSLYYGLLTIFNCVVGACTLHRDLVSRCLRVELEGTPRRLRPQPRVYAKEHRRTIVSECLRALQESTSTWESHSRFSEFEEVGARAYSAVFNTPPEKVGELLEEARQSARFYLPEVFSDFRKHQRKALFYNAPNAVPFGTTELPPDADGARALGLTLTKGIWNED